MYNNIKNEVQEIIDLTADSPIVTLLEPKKRGAFPRFAVNAKGETQWRPKKRNNILFLQMCLKKRRERELKALKKLIELAKRKCARRQERLQIAHSRENNNTSFHNNNNVNNINSSTYNSTSNNDDTTTSYSEYNHTLPQTAPPKSAFRCSCGSVFVDQAVANAHLHYWASKQDESHVLSAAASGIVHNLEGETGNTFVIPQVGEIHTASTTTTTPTNLLHQQQPRGPHPQTSIGALIQSIDEIDNSTIFPQTFVFLPPFDNRRGVILEVDPVITKLHLHDIDYVVFVDFDNCRLYPVTDACPRTLLWAFYGGRLPGIKDTHNLDALCSQRRFWVTRCGRGKNSADLGISFHASQLHFTLDAHVSFAIVSNDKDHIHIKNHLHNLNRNVSLIQKNHIGIRSLRDIIGLLRRTQQTTKPIENKMLATTTTTQGTPMQTTPTTPISPTIGGQRGI